MQFKSVCIQSVAAVLPDEAVTTQELEARLAPLYSRLRLPEGRLELMTGIRERRFFPPQAKTGDFAIQAGQKALQNCPFPRREIGVLIHGSVCRDHLEPATACRVHHALGLPRRAQAFDISNACLGVLTGALQIATMIELGVVRAGLVVGAECGRALVENTLARLNADQTLTRDTVKPYLASLTIGSAAAAMLLCHRDLAPEGDRLIAAAATAATEHHTLCQSEGLSEVMQTDSETLMHAGIAAGAETFELLLEATGWSRDQIDLTVCHQVGVGHRRLMLQKLGLQEANDFATVETLGNTGSAALPSALSLALESGRANPGNRIGLLGIGSGVNCLMLGVERGGE